VSSLGVRIVVAVGVGMGLPAVANAAGVSPGVGSGGGGGSSWQGHSLRFVTFPQGHRTLVAAVRTNGGRVVRYRTIAGRFAVPLVAYDGSAEALAPDGRRLVLAHGITARFPRHSDFVVLSAQTLKVLAHVRLRGAFSFDALSPRGDMLYLIERVARDVTRYQVRAYDLRRGHLLERVIADRRTGERRMQGFPVTRLQTADGGWAYTLYQDPRGLAFVHALDTRTMTAHCIDLPGVHVDDFSTVRLALGAGGSRLVLQDGDQDVAAIDTGTFHVAPFATASAPQPAASAAARGSSGWSEIILTAAALVVIGAAAVGVRKLVKRRGSAVRA
jgi:hypothetical protein